MEGKKRARKLGKRRVLLSGRSKETSRKEMKGSIKRVRGRGWGKADGFYFAGKLGGRSERHV